MTTPQDPADTKPEEPTSPAAESPAPIDASEIVRDEDRELTPEEQMALYEDSLKETDWGHQPC